MIQIYFFKQYLQPFLESFKYKSNTYFAKLALIFVV